ncbi:MAG: non-ribosomal peptide synthetase, partial [Verrucomicrobiota bacterium]
TVALAGELFPQPLVDALYALPHMRRVFELYGPTETTVYSTGSLRKAGGKPSLGYPFPNERVYVLDRRLQPVPVGVPGELYIGGDKLARGYLNRPELTAEKFLMAPFMPDERIYKTGDAVRFLADGSLEFIGRLDHQVKIRGFRVELGEVETALAAHPSVAESVVITRPDSNGNNRLLAYVVLAVGASAEARALREHLAKDLPDYMVPSAVTVLDKFPLTANGKLDRRALPEPDFGAVEAATEAPRTLTEELLVDMWRDVLQLPKLGINDNFFELGGHSLLATQVMTRVREGLGAEISMAQFFSAPTIAALAEIVERVMIEEIKANEGSENNAGEALAKA